MENPDLEAERGRRLLEESPEIVLVLDDEDRLVVASRRARETLDGLVLGEPVPARASTTRALAAQEGARRGRRQTRVAGLAA